MSYRIVGDSCSDPTEAMKQDPHFRFVPLTLIVGDTHVTDDESFDQKAFLKLVAESPEGPKTACPSPEQYLREFECDADMVFAVTLSSKLSGSYQSAVIAKQMYEEHHGEDKKIFIVDSLSAGCGQTNICLRLQELCEEGKTFEEIVETITGYRDGMKTLFVLESLDALKKNGRLTGLASVIVTVLNIKLVMAGIGGVIHKLGQERGIDRALKKMVSIAVNEGTDFEKKCLCITNVNCRERAEKVRDMLTSQVKFRDAVIVDAAGVSTAYASDGGIIVTF
ncbi:DegV family protein [[Clostridium] aminophilum]|uniref:DegV family protein n=1 Tax=[Clostridium] aminophilum TaxID=1526 RepID=UPI0026F237F9|nr:DegV family protein [[Clostridium] aminophilum]MDD6197009.1 DegV family protein [[Clostridium] aminophilum]